MAYILTSQLHDDDDSLAGSAWDRYTVYLESVADRLPSSALALARSDWWFNSTDHRCPHDARLQALTVTEAPSPDGCRAVSIQVRLQGAYSDGHLKLTYHGVTSHEFSWTPQTSEQPFGHRDWRYDEFRLASPGLFEHEIEWWGQQATGRWLIRAAQIEAQWTPSAGTDSAV